MDLVYLDPPLGTNQDYNVLFAERDGTRTAAQIKAFEDAWRWDRAAAEAFHETVAAGGRVADALVALEKFLGHKPGAPGLGYLANMAPRLFELHHVRTK